MDVFDVLNFICGVALFLYGMFVMGEAIEKLAGGKFKSVLKKITANPLTGIALGAGVTSLIQSSSATTVLVVGLVNAGIMTLESSVSVIMGASIGTTITAWIMSLTGIQSTQFVLQMFKPSSFTPILAAIGICLIMFSKSDKKKTIAQIMFGFTVLIVGMEMMVGAIGPLSQMPEFTQILTYFENPALGVFTGTFVTAIIQSSSASVGILQAMAMTGSISYAVAIPVILGQNIGTCITAIIASAGTGSNAKRAAVLHLYFKVIGAIVFMVLYYLLGGLLGEAFMDRSITPAGIAAAHTVYNILNTVALLPFRKFLIKISTATIKDRPIDVRFRLLDDVFLATPAFAIAQCRTLAGDMARLSRKTLFMALDLMKEYKEEDLKKIMDNENDSDVYEDSIGNYLVKVAGVSTSMEDSREVSGILHVIGDFERISDHAVNISQSIEEMEQKGLSFSEEALSDLEVMGGAVREIIDNAVTAFAKNDADLAMKIEPLEDVIDKLRAQLKERHIKRLQRGACTTELGFIFSDVITNLERVSDHCSNIGISVINSFVGGLEPHQFLNTLSESESETMESRYERYLDKYKLV